MARSWRGQYRERAVFEAGRLRGLSFFISTRLSKANWRRPAGTGGSHRKPACQVLSKELSSQFPKPPSPSLWRLKKKKLCGSASMHFRKKSVSYSEGFFVVVFFNRLLLLHCWWINLFSGGQLWTLQTLFRVTIFVFSLLTLGCQGLFDSPVKVCN